MSRTCPECHIQYDDEIFHCPEDGTDLNGVEPDDELIGRSIGSYRVSRLLGKGGMGAVYMAEHPVIGSRVAIKFLHPQYAGDRKIVDRFFNEARAVNVIGHDNILKILDLNVTEDNRHYFVMEFLHGKALGDLVTPDAPLALEVAGPIVLQICEALQAAHEHKIVHRDLKPDNVYLTIHKGKKNFVKVVDFGIAKLTDESGQSTGKTQTGMVMGTPAYMSPEQAGGLTSRIDARSDIYSLGCVMFQLATGKLPFPGSSFGEVLIGHLQVPPPRPRELVAQIPPQYEAVILKCLEKKQEDRYQSMRELHDALSSVMEGLGISRELPVANAEEIAAAQGPKTVTGPGGTLSRPTPRPTPQSRRSTPAPAGTQYAPPPAHGRKRSVAGVVAIAVVAVLVAGGGVALAMYQRAETRRIAEQEQRRVEEERRRAAEALAKAQQEARPAEPQKIFLSVVSDPLGAHAVATWQGGEKAGETPLELEVPKDSRVHIAFSRQGKLPYAMDVLADTAHVVTATLADEPRVATASTAAAPDRARSARRKPAKKAAAPQQPSPDETIPVEFDK